MKWRYLGYRDKLFLCKNFLVYDNQDLSTSVEMKNYGLYLLFFMSTGILMQIGM